MFAPRSALILTPGFLYLRKSSSSKILYTSTANSDVWILVCSDNTKTISLATIWCRYTLPCYSSANYRIKTLLLQIKNLYLKESRTQLVNI